VCGERKLILNEGICLTCSKEPRGKIVENVRVGQKGMEVKSKTGKKDENIWMQKK